MTVEELIKILSHCPSNAEIHFHDESEDIYDVHVSWVNLQNRVETEGIISSYVVISISES